MNSNRKTAIIVGVLIIITYCGIFLGMAVSDPILNAPDYLINVYPNQTQVIIGGLLELSNHAAIIGIAVMLFPIFKKRNEKLALGYVGIRVIEAAMYSVAVISLLSLITLSQEYILAGAPADSYFPALGTLALALRYWAGEVAVPFFILGALIFYCLWYQSKLIPRFISVWGFIAVASLIAANVLGPAAPTEGFNPLTLLFFPIMANELFLAVWLIVKGFNPSAIASLSAKTDTNEIK